MSVMSGIGIMGGSFDPPHIGHIKFAKDCSDTLGLRKVLLVPANTMFWKPWSKQTSFGDRMEMCKIAVKGYPQIEVSDLEAAAGTRAFTAFTLETISRKYPGEPMFLIVGDDVALNIANWYRVDLIRELATVVVAERSSNCEETYKERLTAAGVKWITSNAKPLIVSSTRVRQQLKEKRCSDLIEPGVLDYILSKNLYIK